MREGGIHALQSVGWCCRGECNLSKRARLAQGRRNHRLLLSGFMVHCTGAGDTCVWYGTRTRDSQIHILVLYHLS